MPDLIQLLPDSIANQIAAGEVIQRPASVVKELLENSVDAGASHIELIVRDAGKTLLQVVDDGCGMSETDARMSFERHATSKIRAYEDLFNIRTKGFRGEALASLAAVARVEMKTRPHDQETGTLVRIEGSQVTAQEPCQCPPGTSIAVKNLFYNTPARRNFLKSNNVENRHILNEFERVALAHPGIHFRMQNNDLEVYHLPVGKLRQRIIGVLGKNLNERLIPVEEATEFVKIYGFIGKPEFARRTRGEQFFFANQRYIRSPYLHHAVLQAYEELLPSGAHPLYILFLEMNPASVDVNVHPTKQEVKFEHEKMLYAFLQSAIRKALGRYSVAPTLDFSQEQAIDTGQIPASPVSRTPARETSQQDWKELYAITREGAAPKTVTVPSDWPETKPEQPSIHKESDTDIRPFQIRNSFIVVEIKSGFLIIDQQAAHECILYEKFRKALEEGNHPTQRKLFPQQFELGAGDAQILKSLLRDINALGFDIQEFGKNGFIIHGIPAELENVNELEMIEGVLEQFKLNLDKFRLNPRENLARSLARKAAIPRGKPLKTEEMQQLIDLLFACRDFYRTPDGRLTFISYSLEELERQFGKNK